MATEHERVAQWQDDVLPHMVDRLSRERPESTYAEWVTASGVVVINYAQLANIVNGLASWIVEQIGLGDYGSKPEVLAYIGPNDVRYSALLLAAMKTGYLLFFTSPRNSAAGHRALFDRLQCQTLLTPDPVPPPARGILEAVKPRRHLLVPSVDDLLSKQHPPYVLSKTFQDLRKTPCLVLHTSGSTGLPKPIIWPHETFARTNEAKGREPPAGVSSVDQSLFHGQRAIVTLPPFHGAALSHYIFGAIPFGTVPVAPVAAGIPTAQAVVDALKQSPADVALLVPSIVSELAQNPELLDYCAAHLKAIVYIGGDLPQNIGDRVASKIYLRSQWGATETGIVPQLIPPELEPSAESSRSLWRYFRYHPCVGATFDAVTNDGVFEMVVRRDEALADTQPCFGVEGIDQLDEYRTKDLLEPHPDISDLWCWRARSDDIIVFLNGEKTNPISMEQLIAAKNPELSAVMVIGAQRFQAALLIQPADEALTTADEAALIERIWPSVEEANRQAPAHARVEKSFILVAPRGRPLIRAGKGTLMRAPNIAQYTEEIERLYANADVVHDEDGETAVQSTDLVGVTRLVRQHLHVITSLTAVGDDDNFFDLGIDSLQGLQLTRALRRSLHRHDFGLSTIYQNPSISQLSAAIVAGSSEGQDERKLMETLLETYRGLIQQIKPPAQSERRPTETSGPVNVLLTGSTGTVGTYLLRALLDRQGVGHIFCLNRSEVSNGVGGDGGRVTFIKADLQQPQLGLDAPTYASLREQVGIILHTAWPVNFNLPLSAFRPQMAGLVNLLALAAAAPGAVHFVFTSSIAAVEGHTEGPAAEAVLVEPDTPASMGYGRSKFVAEQLVDAAARHLGGGGGSSDTAAVTASVVRIGQVAGSVRGPGLWSPREWLPSLVLSSLHLGAVPDSLGPRFDAVDFVPVDVLADVLVDIATTTTNATTAGDGAVVYNVRNPHLTSWRTLLPAVTARAGGPPLQAVSPAAWLASLRESGDVSGDYDALVATNPGLKLIDTYSALSAAGPDAGAVPPMVVERALAASPTLRALDPVRLEWMQKWVQEWADFRGE